MKSIRSKLLLTFILLIISLVSIGLLINLFFLETFYIHQKTITIKDSSQKLQELYQQYDKDDLISYVDNLEKSHGFSIEILSNNGLTLYSTLKGDSKLKLSLLDKEQIKNAKPNVSENGMSRLKHALKNQSFYVTKTNLKSIDLEFLLVGSKLDRNKILIIRTPITSINESVAIYNYFLIYIGLALLCVGTVIGLIFARSFTKPILEINKMAKEMTSLSFTRKWKQSRRDELGQLGYSMNELSRILSNFIEKLNIKNINLSNELEEKVQFEKKRRTFISNVSHELKTPITIIQSYTEGLQVGIYQSEEEKQEYLDIIMDEANKMEKMVFDLLNLSKLQNSKVEVYLEEVNLNKLVNEIIRLYSPQFNDNQINFQFVENSNDEGTVATDRLKVTHIINNYINNALTHVNGESQIQISISENENEYKVSVFNSGKCIPESEIDVIWESFYRSDTARNREKGNVGLGLSIVKELSIMINAKIGVQNENDGVTFWLELPKHNNMM